VRLALNRVGAMKTMTELRSGSTLKLIQVWSLLVHRDPLPVRGYSLSSATTVINPSAVRVPFTAHVTNQEVCLRSAQPPVTQTVMLRRLRFFGHVIRSDPDEDHTRASRNVLVVGLVKHGYAPSRTTSNISTVVGPAQSL